MVFVAGSGGSGFVNRRLIIWAEKITRLVKWAVVSPLKAKDLGLRRERLSLP